MQPQSTTRLVFRPVQIHDAHVLNALNHAPGVMKYLDRTPPPLYEVQTKIIPEQMRIAREHRGCGMWLAHLISESGECIGWFELEPKPRQALEVEIGYRLFPEFWGQGLATEGARELVRYAFDDLDVSRCVAITMAVNVPSRKVMERIGLNYVRTFYEDFEDPLPGTEEGEVEYALTRDEWLLRRP